MKTIVTPLDGSALAERVLPYVQLLARLLDARIMLLRVVTDEEQQLFLLRHAADLGIEPLPNDDWQCKHRAIEELSRHAEMYLASHADTLRAAGLAVTIAVEVGSPAECIAKIAHRRTDPLIVMSTHGYSGLRRWTLGSVADRVVHITTAPVLLVRSGVALPEPIALRRILVPLDGSAFAQQALPVAAELAQAAHAQLLLLQVTLPLIGRVPALSPFGRSIQVAPELIAEEIERTRQQLQLALERLGRPELDITPVVEMGYPAEAILDTALKRQADLIVMTTHGRSGLERWVLGSIADKVLHAASTPVLLIRAQPVEA